MTQEGPITDAQRLIANRNLNDAVASADVTLLDLCLQKGGDINNTLAWKNRTPLMQAVANGNAAMVEAVLARGPDLLLKDREGNTVFDLVRELNNEALKKKINNMLLTALPDAVPQAPASPALAEITGVADDITVLKPIELDRHKKGASLKL